MYRNYVSNSQNQAGKEMRTVILDDQKLQIYIIHRRKELKKGFTGINIRYGTVPVQCGSRVVN
jgi:hypothetical protein